MKTRFFILLIMFFLYLPNAKAETRYYDTDYGAVPTEDSTVVECTPARQISRQISYYEKTVAKDLQPMFPQVRVKIRTHNKYFLDYQPTEKIQAFKNNDISLTKISFTGNFQKLKSCKIMVPAFISVRARVGGEYFRANFRKAMTVSGFQTNRNTKEVHVAMANYKRHKALTAPMQ